MEKFEKIERLRELAGISYEEAKQVLEEADDDLLAATLDLEKQGKIKGRKSFGNSTAGNAVRSVLNFFRTNAFHVLHNEKDVIVMPAWAFGILMLFFHTLIPVMLVSLLFNVRYQFTGMQDTEKVNYILDQAGNLADGLKNASEAVISGNTSGK